MESQTKTRKKDWQMTQEGFDKLLASFDEDRKIAGEKYELLRCRLIKFFEWRKSPTPEEHADETFNRVARKLVEGVAIDNINSFIGGVARRLIYEMFEEKEREQKALGKLAEPVVVTEIKDEETDPRLDCFRACLKELPEDQRRLIVDYYREDEKSRIEQRKALANTLGIPLNALRIRAYRLRVQLDNCIRNCLKDGGAGCR